MSALGDYLNDKREQAYEAALQNTKRNSSGRAVIAKDDEWRNEHEWDDLFVELKKK